MNMSRVPLRSIFVLIGVGGTATIIAGSSACIVDEIPACPGQCFEFTVERESPTKCLTAMSEGIEIPFTGTDPPGYHGRHCFNSPSVAHVMDAIEHLEVGGLLSDLDIEVQNAYLSTVATVQADLESECITAAPGQCTNAAEICSGIAADMYEQLVVDQTCTLELGGVEPIELEAGEVCEFGPVVQGTGSVETGEHCTEATGDGADQTTTADSGSADETTGEGSTGDDTGMMVDPFGNIEALVHCDSPDRCEVDPELYANLSTNFTVFYQESVTLTLVGEQSPCGPGARVDGLGEREHTTRLAQAFGVRNGDIIGQIGSTTMSSFAEAMDGLTALLEDGSTTLVLRRAEGLGCETIVVDIDVS